VGACWVVIVHGVVPLTRAAEQRVAAVHLRFMWAACERTVTASNPPARTRSRSGEGFYRYPRPAYEEAGWVIGVDPDDAAAGNASPT
jgi:hypothetical protein